MGCHVRVEIDCSVHLRSTGPTGTFRDADAALGRFLLHPCDGEASAALHREDVHQAASCNVVPITNHTEVVVWVHEYVVAPVGPIEVRTGSCSGAPVAEEGVDAVHVDRNEGVAPAGLGRRCASQCLDRPTQLHFFRNLRDCANLTAVAANAVHRAAAVNAVTVSNGVPYSSRMVSEAQVETTVAAVVVGLGLREHAVGAHVRLHAERHFVFAAEGVVLPCVSHWWATGHGYLCQL